MKTKTFIAATFVLASFGAQADLSEEITVTDFTGRIPHDPPIVLQTNSSGPLIIERITMGEIRDDPCFLQLHYKDLNTGEVVRGTPTFAECGGGNYNPFRHNSPKKVFIRHLYKDNYFPVGASVCLNRQLNKVKGLQLIGEHKECVLGAESVDFSDGVQIPNYRGERRIVTCGENLNDGDLYKTVVTDHFARKNCSVWEDAVRCPSGSVVTGMELAVRDGRNNREIIEGLRLRCQELLPPQIPRATPIPGSARIPSRPVGPVVVPPTIPFP